MKSRLYPFSAIIVAIISIQMGAAFAKQLFPVAGPVGITALRLFFASIMLSLFWQPWRQKLDRKQLLAVVLYGLSLGAMNFFFYLAIARIPLGLAVALEFSGPLTLAIFASRKLTDVLWATMAIMGIVLIAPIGETSVIDPLGVIFALLAAALWAFYIIFGHRAARLMHEGRATAFGMIIATLSVTPVAIGMGAHQAITIGVLPSACMVALLSSAIPYSLEMFALKRLSKLTFGILMSLEPAAAALFGFIFLKEHLDAGDLLAIFLIIAASLGATFASSLTGRAAGSAKIHTKQMLGNS